MQHEHPSGGYLGDLRRVRVSRVVARRSAWSQVALVATVVAVYELLRTRIRPNWAVATAHARDLAAWERAAHVAWERPLQRAFLDLPPLVEAMNVFYLAGSFVLTGAFFVWLYRRTPHGYGLFRDAFLVATAIAFVIEWRYPTAPPRLAGIGVEDTLRRMSGIDIGSRGTGGLTDPVAAMPSLHAGWASGVGIGLLVYARSWWGKAAGVTYPVLVAATVIVTGNHFVLDTLAGIVLVGACLGVATSMDRSRVVGWGSRRGVEQSGSSPGS